jgi:hypothetical protein
MSPDELLLALIDLVTLAFPEPLYEMTVSFVPNESGTRPALSNLDGKARPNQPKRPDLGFKDDEVLDEINALLTEFADATARAGVRVLDGRIVIRNGIAELYEGDQKKLERAFDENELSQLLWTSELFAALNSTEKSEQQQREAVFELLKGVKRFNIDMERRRIEFTPGGLTLRFEPLGSWSDEMWTWTYVHSKGPRAFVDASFSCPELCADRLARHTAVGLNAIGMYKAPYASNESKGTVYLALFEL